MAFEMNYLNSRKIVQLLSNSETRFGQQKICFQRSIMPICKN